MDAQTPNKHTKKLRIVFNFIVILHGSNIFWCWLLYLGQSAENQWLRAIYIYILTFPSLLQMAPAQQAMS